MLSGVVGHRRAAVARDGISTHRKMDRLRSASNVVRIEDERTRDGTSEAMKTARWNARRKTTKQNHMYARTTG